VQQGYQHCSAGDIYTISFFSDAPTLAQKLIMSRSPTPVSFSVKHCTENPIYVFPEMKLLGLVPIPAFMYQ
jgi:hypothetical protein